MRRPLSYQELVGRVSLTLCQVPVQSREACARRLKEVGEAISVLRQESRNWLDWPEHQRQALSFLYRKLVDERGRLEKLLESDENGVAL